MPVAVSATGATLDDAVHEQFGRCSWFLIIDDSDQVCSARENPFAATPTGAGPACAQILFDENVTAVITSKVGPHAFEALQAGAVDIMLARPGTSVREAVAQYRSGTLTRMQLQKF